MAPEGGGSLEKGNLGASALPPVPVEGGWAESKPGQQPTRWRAAVMVLVFTAEETFKAWPGFCPGLRSPGLVLTLLGLTSTCHSSDPLRMLVPSLLLLPISMASGLRSVERASQALTNQAVTSCISVPSCPRILFLST